MQLSKTKQNSNCLEAGEKSGNKLAFTGLTVLTPLNRSSFWRLTQLTEVIKKTTWPYWKGSTEPFTVHCSHYVMFQCVKTLKNYSMFYHTSLVIREKSVLLPAESLERQQSYHGFMSAARLIRHRKECKASAANCLKNN